MRAGKRVIEHVAPWLGMLGAGLGWFFSQQVGSNMSFDDCRAGDAAFVLLVSAVGLVLALGGGYYSWDVWRRREAETEGRRFIGLIGLLLALVAAFAILLQGLSGLILPDCAA